MPKNAFLIGLSNPTRKLLYLMVYSICLLAGYTALILYLAEDESSIEQEQATTVPYRNPAQASGMFHI